MRAASGWRTGTNAPAFPLPFGHRHSLLGRPVPATESSSPHGRPADDAQAAPPDLGGVYTFHTHETRPGRASSLPRGRRCSYDHRDVRGRRLPPHNDQPLPPRYCPPTRDVMMTRHQQGFTVISPFGLPLTCDTRSEQAPLDFPLSFAPSRYRPRTSRRGQVWNTDLKSRLRRHAEPPIDELTHYVRPRVAPHAHAAPRAMV
jgi:hypothetical protein